MESMEDDHFARRNERDAGEALKSLRANNAEKKRGDGTASGRNRLPWVLIAGAALVVFALIGGIVMTSKSRGDKPTSTAEQGVAVGVGATSTDLNVTAKPVGPLTVPVTAGPVPFAESLIPGESPAATAPAAKAGSGAVSPGGTVPVAGKPVLTPAERAKAASAAKANALQPVLRDPGANAGSNAVAATVVTPVVEPAASRPTVVSSAASTVTARPSVPASPPPVARSPAEACEGRILLGFDSCMTEQCARPNAVSHPVCIERREIERRRREREESRSF
jgi:eukaryotic-like serine/threonine-protein kinase